MNDIIENEYATAQGVAEESAAHLDELNARIELAQAKSRHSLTIAGIIAGLVVLVIVLALAGVLREKSQGDEANGKKIDDLSVKLEDARQDIIKLQTTNSESTQCADRFTNAQRAANLDAFAAQNEVVNELIPSDTPVDPEVRAQHLRELRDEGRESIAYYRSLVAQSKAWGEAGRPLPCPIAP